MARTITDVLIAGARIVAKAPLAATGTAMPDPAGTWSATMEIDFYVMAGENIVKRATAIFPLDQTRTNSLANAVLNKLTALRAAEVD